MVSESSSDEFPALNLCPGTWSDSSACRLMGLLVFLRFFLVGRNAFLVLV